MGVEPMVSWDGVEANGSLKEKGSGADVVKSKPPVTEPGGEEIVGLVVGVLEKKTVGLEGGVA